MSASYDAADGAGAIFLVNRSQTEAVTAELVWQDKAPAAVQAAWQLVGTDVKAANTWDSPNRITAQAIPMPPIVDGKATVLLPWLSFTVFATR